LKKYPSIIIKNQINPKKVRSNFIFITFFNIKNSGRLSQTTAIIKASHVHRGIHLSIKDSIIGIILVAFVYIGIHRITDRGTANGCSTVIYFWKNHSGTYQ
jgi:hypothetical protein